MRQSKQRKQAKARYNKEMCLAKSDWKRKKKELKKNGEPIPENMKRFPIYWNTTQKREKPKW